jgi:hypothetical protein
MAPRDLFIAEKESKCEKGTILYCPVKRKYTVKEKQWVSRSLLFCAYLSSGCQHGTPRFRRFSRYDEPSTLSLPISGIAPIERLTHNPLSKLMGSARGPVLSPTRSWKASTLLIGLSRRNSDHLFVFQIRRIKRLLFLH